jgi:hypothetical protein
MLKQLLTGSSVLVLLLAGGLSAQAQVPQSSSSPSSSQLTGTPQTQVSPDDLQKFARSIKQLRVIQQGERQQIVQLVSQSGLSRERFMEIYQAQQTPPQQPKQAITPKEQQQFNIAFAKIGQIQQQNQSKKERVVQKEGLQPARFNQILEAVRQDSSLQEKVKQMIQP